MANWSGTYSITTPGTAPTAVSSTTMTNTGASWPTSPSLAGWWVRILSGPGVGTITQIVSNTATVITVSAWSGTQPTTGSTYELVHILANGDNITATLIFGNNCITEIADNAIINVTAGSVSLQFTGVCTARWNKTETTFATVQGVNRTTAGTFGSWTGPTINLSNGAVVSFSYIKFLDCVTGITIAPNQATGTGSIITKIWCEGIGNNAWNSAGTPDQNKTWTGFYFTNSKSLSTQFANANTAFTEQLDRWWSENSQTHLYATQSNASTIQRVRDSVNLQLQNSQFDNIGGTGKFVTHQDSYYKNTPLNDGAILVGNSSGTGTSNYECRRNTIDGTRTCFGAGTGGVGILTSKFNDWVRSFQGGFPAIVPANSTSFGTCTSDNDYMSGTNGAILSNVDTSASTTSTATPHQYQNLTATRTNPKSVRNRPLVCDNIVVGTPTSTSATITFDCQNGVVAGQGSTTVNADSASGQKVLSLASTTGFEVGELIEIGYGTARQENGRIASISAGVSVTLESNLSFTHTTVQADTVKKQLRHFGLPFIRYGTTSGSYNMQSQIPDRSTWGPIFIGWQTKYNGMTVAWNRIGHSITLQNLKPNTTYYIQACAYNPLEEILVSSEVSFTTASAPSGIMYSPNMAGT